METKLKEELEKAKKTPDAPLFFIRDVKKITRLIESNSIRDYDYLGITKIHKNPAGHRMFSYNDIQFILALRVLTKESVNLLTIKILMDFEKKEGRDPKDYIHKLSKYYYKKKYDIKPPRGK